MTIETLEKAKKIGDEINTMEELYNIILRDDCIILISEDGFTTGKTFDSDLIKAFKNEILRRRDELVEELERL